MMDGSEYSFDWMRIFFGDFNLFIYLEILLRVTIIMTYTILIIRWIGKRVVGEVGPADVLLIIAMGSAVGDAMFYPEIPIFIPISVITLIAAFQKLYVHIAVKYESVRKITDPKVTKLVENGKFLKENFEVDQIDENEVYMLLREAGVRYLSEVEHAYYEQSGELSIYKFENPTTFEHSILPEDLDEIK